MGAGQAVEGYPLSVSWAVDYWIRRGASPSKLTMGLATYGRGWKLADPGDAGYNAPASGACEPGPSTREAGYRAYYEIQDLLASGKAVAHYDEERQCPYVRGGRPDAGPTDSNRGRPPAAPHQERDTSRVDASATPAPCQAVAFGGAPPLQRGFALPSRGLRG